MESYENKTMELLGADTPKQLFENVKLLIKTSYSSRGCRCSVCWICIMYSKVSKEDETNDLRK